MYEQVLKKTIKDFVREGRETSQMHYKHKMHSVCTMEMYYLKPYINSLKSTAGLLVMQLQQIHCYLQKTLFFQAGHFISTRMQTDN